MKHESHRAYRPKFSVVHLIDVIGPPYSGKTSHAGEIRKFVNGYWIDTGKTLRTALKDPTSPYHTKVLPFESQINNGRLLEDEFMNGLITARFHDALQTKNKGPERTIILSGFPRSLGQLRFLESGLIPSLKNTLKIPIDIRYIYLNVPKEVCLERVEMRRMRVVELGHLLRADDAPSVVRVRFEEYMKHTAPMIEMIPPDRVSVVTNTESFEEAHQKILHLLGLRPKRE